MEWDENSTGPPDEQQKPTDEEEYIDYLYEQAEDYNDQVREILDQRYRQERYLRLIFILSSLASGFLIFLGAGSSSSLELSYVLYGVLFGVLAFGSALGIVRWALFDVLSPANDLR